MRLVILCLLLFSIIISKASSDVTEELVNKLKKSNNYNFKFIQNINEKKKREIVFWNLIKR